MNNAEPFDARLLAVIDELETLAKTRDDAWQVPRVEGQMLYHIALATGARLIVEIGTSYGFSGLWWAAALRQTGGHLVTIDANPKKTEAARQAFVRAGVSDFVTPAQGDARAVLRDGRLPGPVDLAFIDADKPSTRAYFDLLWPRLRAGGSVLTDNVVTHRQELADFVAHVRSRPDATSVELPVGNGIEWTVKTGPQAS